MVAGDDLDLGDVGAASALPVFVDHVATAHVKVALRVRMLARVRHDDALLEVVLVEITASRLHHDLRLDRTLRLTEVGQITAAIFREFYPFHLVTRVGLRVRGEVVVRPSDDDVVDQVLVPKLALFGPRQ